MEKLNLASPGRWLSLAVVSLGMLIIMPRSANAQSALTWARVELTRNQVQLFTNGQSRRARVSDVLGVGDALSTANRARAELRFNDGSLARIGESAVFQFTPNTRNFRLSNGTVLLLIPPGQGRTTIQTPNAVTGIHGSALFVRFIPETDTTIIGALTNNPEGPMMAFNQDGSQQQPLHAGEMAVLRGNEIVERFDFELETFYETSDLVVGLQLDRLEAETGDQAVDAVRQEIRDALDQQEQFDNNDSDIIENPSFISANRREPQASTTAIPDFSASPAASFLQRNGIDEGFASVISGTVNSPIGDQDPPTIEQPDPEPPAVKPPTPAPLPMVEKPPTPIPAPSQPVVPTPAPTPNPTEPVPGEVPTQPIEKPPTPVIPEATMVEVIEQSAPIVSPELNVPEPAPAPVTVSEPAPAPVVVVAPEATVLPPTEVIVPSFEKPPISVESVAPVEAIVPEPVAPVEVVTPVEPVAPVEAIVPEVIAPVEPVAPVEAIVPEIIAPVEPVAPVEAIVPEIIAPVETTIVPVETVVPVEAVVPVTPSRGATVIPTEVVIPPAEVLGGINVIEDVVQEPETEVQVDRLPDNVITPEPVPTPEKETIPEVLSENSPEGTPVDIP